MYVSPRCKVHVGACGGSTCTCMTSRSTRSICKQLFKAISHVRTLEVDHCSKWVWSRQKYIGPPSLKGGSGYSDPSSFRHISLEMHDVKSDVAEISWWKTPKITKMGTWLSGSLGTCSGKTKMGATNGEARPMLHMLRKREEMAREQAGQ